MKTLRAVCILLLFIVFVFFCNTIYQAVWGADPVRFSVKSSSDMAGNSGLVSFVVVVFVEVVAGVVFLVFLSALRSLSPVEIGSGVTAQASVLKVWDTGYTINNDPQVALLLEVMPAGGGPSFQVKTKAVVSRLDAALVRPGKTVMVEYDPKRPRRLRISSLDI